MRIIRKSSIILFVSIFLISLLKPASATSKLSDFSYLQGVDTIVVSETVLPEHLLLPQKNNAANNDAKIYSTVKSIFADQPWIKVLRESDITYANRVKSNVLVLNYGVSAQRGFSAKEEINVGSIVMTQIIQDKVVSAGLASTPVSYPFVISDKQDETERKIAEGVHYLTDYLPSYFACANKRGECLPIYPFQEKIFIPCPASAMGQKIPVPCGER